MYDHPSTKTPTYMYVLYSLLILILGVIVSPYLAYQAIRYKKYIGSLGQRMGYLPVSFNLDGEESIWIHAVSVGETMTVRAFIADLRRRYPNLRIFLSTTTMAGRAPENVSGIDLHDRAAFALRPAFAGGDDQCLSQRMTVPRRPRSGLEGHSCASHARRRFPLELHVDPDVAGEVRRRPLAGWQGSVSIDVHGVGSCTSRIAVAAASSLSGRLPPCAASALSTLAAMPTDCTPLPFWASLVRRRRRLSPGMAAP